MSELLRTQWDAEDVEVGEVTSGGLESRVVGVVAAFVNGGGLEWVELSSVEGSGKDADGMIGATIGGSAHTEETIRLNG